MKKIISCFLAVFLCMQVNVFAKTVTKKVTVPYDFTVVDANYDTSANGWNKKGTIVAEKGVKIYDISYTTELGNDYEISGELTFTNNGNQFGNVVRFCFGENLNIGLGNGSSSGGYNEIRDGNTELVKLPGAWSGGVDMWSGDFKFDLSIKNNLLTYTFSIGNKTQTGTFDTSDYTVNSFGMQGHTNRNVILKNISFSYNTTYDLKPLNIMPGFQSFGVNTTEALPIYFSTSVTETDFEDALEISSTSGMATITGVEMTNNNRTALISIAASDDDECTLTIPSDFTATDGEYLTTDYAYEFTVDNTNVQEYLITVTPTAEKDILYNEYRFDDEYYFGGKIVLDSSDNRIYFGSSETDGVIDGYRLSVVPGDAGEVVLQKVSGADIQQLDSSSTKFKVGDTAYFGVEIKDNKAMVSVVGDYAFAMFEVTDIDLTGGYVGVGGITADKISDMVVNAIPGNTFQALTVLDYGTPFNAFAVYKAGEPVKVRIKLNALQENVRSAKIKVDGAIETPLIYENGEYTAFVGNLAEGIHSIVAEFADKYGDVHIFNSKGIMISDKTVVADGFYDGDTKIASSISSVAGKTIAAKFNCDMRKDYLVMITLSDSTGKLKKAAYAKCNGMIGVANITLPDNVEGCSLKAFVCESLENSVPLSGYLELK